MEQYKKVGNLKVRTDLSPEKQALVNQIAQNYVNQNKKIDAEARKGYLRGGLGSVVSGLSFHPIMNIPYVGTGVGGAMYDLGQGIVAGDKAKDLLKRAGRGFAIGETVGAIPYVGKAASKTKAGQAVLNSAPVKAVGDTLNKAGEKIAANPTVQKAYDALMTDVRAFNPNKQTVYHGSPYDFNKFSNEAIGTGEGAQAHGYGHYTALGKDVADTRYRKRLVDDNLYENVELNGQEIEKMPFGGYQYKNSGEKAAQGNGLVLDMALNRLAKNGNNVDSAIESVSKELDISNPWKYDVIDFLKNNNIKVTPNEGQLYKLSVPKDDVMLREDALMSNQPNMSNLWDEIRLNRVNKSTTSLPKFKMALGANDIDINKTFNTNYFNDALEMVKNNPEKYKDLFLKDMTGKELYGYLESVLGSRKAATEYLQQRGIKGISYNGGIDGEARVIFNPDDIVIGRKYYNQPTLKDIYNKFINSGAIAGAITNP